MKTSSYCRIGLKIEILRNNREALAFVQGSFDISIFHSNVQNKKNRIKSPGFTTGISYTVSDSLFDRIGYNAFSTV